MPPPLLFPIDEIDLDTLVVTQEEIYQTLAHRHEFMLLDGLAFLDIEAKRAVAIHEVREDAWWVRGHIPGRPLLPGVIMIEAAAQVCSFFAARALSLNHFVVFGGVNDVKFREAVVPPARLIILIQAVELRSRRTVSKMQGLVNGRLVVEGRIIGLPLRE